MACSAKRISHLIPPLAEKIKAAAAARSIVCNNCIWNDDGICKVVAAKHGKENADIADGVKRLSLHCPTDRWQAVSVVCPKCGRSTVVSERTGVCKWCDMKQTTGREHRVHYQPRKIPDGLSAMPFKGVPLRHLYFFLYPRYVSPTLYHLDWLDLCSESFNGKRICCVAIDESTHHGNDAIIARLDSYFDQVIYIQNDPSKREAAGFVQGLQMLASTNNDEMVCFAHGKGQQSHTAESQIVRQWTAAMYETVVMNWMNAAHAMVDGFPLSGSFKSVGNFATTAHRWHYSGSFFWARSKALYGNEAWKQLCNQWFAAESYVGRHFASGEGHCLFGDHIAGGSMYQPATWKRLLPELEQWRINNERIARKVTATNLGVRNSDV